MFRVESEVPFEQWQLDENHHQVQPSYFHVSTQEAPALAPFLSSINYQIYRQRVSPLAQQVTRLANDALNLHLSLTLFRRVITSIRQLQQQLERLQQYVRSIEECFSQPSDSQSSDHEPALQSRVVDLTHVDPMPSISQLKGMETDKVQKAQEQSVRSPFSTIHELLKHDYTYKEQTSPTQPTRRRKTEAQSSMAISQFKMNGTGMLEGHNFQGLLQEQRFFERERETELALRAVKSDDSLVRHFRRKMKNNLMIAKLRVRKAR